MAPRKPRAKARKAGRRPQKPLRDVDQAVTKPAMKGDLIGALVTSPSLQPTREPEKAGPLTASAIPLARGRTFGFSPPTLSNNSPACVGDNGHGCPEDTTMSDSKELGRALTINAAKPFDRSKSDTVTTATSQASIPTQEGTDDALAQINSHASIPIAPVIAGHELVRDRDFVKLVANKQKQLRDIPNPPPPKKGHLSFRTALVSGQTIRDANLSPKQQEERLPHHIEQIGQSWYRTFDGILETSLGCLQASAEITAKGLRKKLVAGLPFNESVFSMLCSIGRAADLIRPYKNYLPASYSTLYLASLGDGHNIPWLARYNKINSSMTRNQMRTALDELRHESGYRAELQAAEKKEGPPKETEPLEKNPLAGKQYAVIMHPEFLPTPQDRARMADELIRLCKKFKYPLKDHMPPDKHWRKALREHDAEKASILKEKQNSA